jgi:hypothetical protein
VIVKIVIILWKKEDLKLEDTYPTHNLNLKFHSEDLKNFAKRCEKNSRI